MAMRTQFYSLSLILVFFSCGKDKLTNNYESFIGKFEWSNTTSNDKNIFSSHNATITPTRTGYNSAFELNSSGEAIFYKNGVQVSKNKFTITEKESSSIGNGKISIKLKGDVKDMTIIKNTLTLRLSDDTLLRIDEFPFPAIDNVDNYASGHGLGDNFFLKK
jgi:hypothetical protein